MIVEGLIQNAISEDRTRYLSHVIQAYKTGSLLAFLYVSTPGWSCACHTLVHHSWHTIRRSCRLSSSGRGIVFVPLTCAFLLEHSLCHWHCSTAGWLLASLRQTRLCRQTHQLELFMLLAFSDRWPRPLLELGPLLPWPSLNDSTHKWVSESKCMLKVIICRH